MKLWVKLCDKRLYPIDYHSQWGVPYENDEHNSELVTCSFHAKICARYEHVLCSLLVETSAGLKQKRAHISAVLKHTIAGLKQKRACYEHVTTPKRARLRIIDCEHVLNYELVF